MSSKSTSFQRLMRFIVAPHRTETSDLLLALALAMIAGATNLGGLFVIGHFASHMTGYLTELADGIVTAQLGMVLLSVMALALFLIGGIVNTTGMYLLSAETHRSGLALLLLGQGALLVLFALAGGLNQGLAQTVGLGVLCFTMGYQNAMVTKLSRFTMRTTHMTGLVTDLSIELGRFTASWFMAEVTAPPMRRTVVLTSVITVFVLGGMLGSLAFAALGTAFTLPFAAILFAWGAFGLTRRPPSDPETDTAPKPGAESDTGQK